VRWKQSLTPLSEVPDLDSGTVARLEALHITTAEELVGHIEAEPTGVGELLDLDEPAVRDLGRRARDVIGADVAEAIDGQREREYKLGALPPEDAD
jgi:hypothetical protein